jgi:hypothetical protein
VIVNEPVLVMSARLCAVFEPVMLSACRAEMRRGRVLEDDITAYLREVRALARVWRDGVPTQVPSGTDENRSCGLVSRMSVTEIASAAKRSPTLVRRACRPGGALAPFAERTGAGWLVDADAAHEWIAERGGAQ